MEELLTRLYGYLRGMWRFRWWGLAVTWLVGVVGGVVVYSIPDRFESSARIFVDTQSVLRPLMSGLAVQPNVDQQVAILSRTLITHPNVEKLISMADLDITIRTPTERESLISSLMSDLEIRSTGRDNLFTLAYRDQVPERAQRVVQALVSLFVESGLVGKQQDSSSARRFIDEQIANYEVKLTEAENRLKEFRLRNMALLGDGGRDYVSQIAELTNRMNEAELELKEAENSRSSLERQLAVEDPMLRSDPSMVSVPEVDARLALLKKNLDEMMLRYTNEHPDVVGVRRVIAQLETEKQQEIESMLKAGGGQGAAPGSNPVFQQLKMALSEADARVASLRARLAELSSRLTQLRSQQELLPKIEAEQTQLNRDYNVHRQNYESLVQRRESASMSVEMSAQGGITEFRVIDPPTLPRTPAAPNRLLLMPLAGFLALAAGVAVTFLIAQLRPAFVEPRDLREVTGLPVLGVISLLPDPAKERADRRRLMLFGGGVASFAVAVGAMTVLLKWLQT
ncbi:chain length-determining protein [Aromatoleum toluolicum]|uniref:Chain length-determining protein n=1 Tax=Aromatoleum toluolicum TaxID=90060 RepID=A0ABX1NBV7_9RHOO|nr:XrtA system polysaccharide chain length determinant [Aromatoleum toluolicum]NMF96756.1 chain length-determining protein [Aromatoleum toluolicum]